LLSVYSGGLQEWNLTKDKLAEIRRRGLTAEERKDAEAFVNGFRDRPERPTGMQTRARLPVADKEAVERLARLGKRYLSDAEIPRSPRRCKRFVNAHCGLPVTKRRSHSAASTAR